MKVHGFSNRTLRKYFENQAWYRSIPGKSGDGKMIYTRRLSDLERRNLQLIRETEQRKRGR